MGLLDAPVFGVEAEFIRSRREVSQLKELLAESQAAALAAGQHELAKKISVALHPTYAAGW